jgi:hypothetical protein
MDDLFRVYLDLRAALATDDDRNALDQKVQLASPYNLAGVIFSAALSLPPPVSIEIADRVIEIKKGETWPTYG